MVDSRAHKRVLQRRLPESLHPNLNPTLNLRPPPQKPPLTPPPPPLYQQQAQGPILSYKLKPAAGWKVANEAAPRIKTVFSSVTYKALQGE